MSPKALLQKRKNERICNRMMNMPDVVDITSTFYKYAIPAPKARYSDEELRKVLEKD